MPGLPSSTPSSTGAPPALGRRRIVLGIAAVALAVAAWGLSNHWHGGLKRQAILAATNGIAGRQQATAPASLTRFSRNAHALGAKIAITVRHHDSQRAEQAIDAALAEIDAIDRVMSLYRPDSQVCRLNAAGTLDDPDPRLVEILRKSLDVSARTGGAFDITVQPLWLLYSRSKGKPDPAELDKTRALVGWRNVEVADRRIRLARPGMAITLNAIAQGYAADRVLGVLRDHGIAHALVDTGEIGSLGQSAPDTPWTAGIQHPRQPDAYIARLRLDGRGVSTSGDYATAFTDDFRAHHIFDPATGKSPQAFASVTVIAPSVAEADALSTALAVLGYERGIQLIQTLPRTDVLFVLKDGKVLATPNVPLIPAGQLE